MRTITTLSVLTLATLLFVSSGQVLAQSNSLSNRDRLFLLYGQINSQRAQRELAQNQQRLQKQITQLGSPSRSQLVSPSADPLGAYLREVEGRAGGRGSATARQQLPAIYFSGRRNAFQDHSRYFNPLR